MKYVSLFLASAVALSVFHMTSASAASADKVAEKCLVKYGRFFSSEPRLTPDCALHLFPPAPGKTTWELSGDHVRNVALACKVSTASKACKVFIDPATGEIKVPRDGMSDL